MLQQLRRLCDEIDISDFGIIVIDNKKNLFAALLKIFSITRYLLYL